MRCARCGRTDHTVDACTRAAAPSRPRAVEVEAEASPWDPDDVPAVPVPVPVPAPRRRPPLTLVMFTSGDAGLTVEAHELALDDVATAAEIVDTWDKPAILARGTRLVHIPVRVPVGLVLAAARSLRGAA